jgi:hypothetical protein
MSDPATAPTRNIPTRGWKENNGDGPDPLSLFKKPRKPRKTIDYEAIEKLGMLQCTHEEIAAFLNVSTSFLAHDRKFLRLHKMGLQKGRMSLRRHQWRALEEGNTTMLVWLGKQYLGQRDRFEHSGNVDLNVNSLLEDMRERARQQREPQLIEGQIIEGEDAP